MGAACRYNQPHLQAQQFFKLALALNLFLILFLNRNTLCLSLFSSWFAVVSLQHYGRQTSSVLPINSVSIRPGKPAACSPASFSREHSVSIVPAAVYDHTESTIVHVLLSKPHSISAEKLTNLTNHCIKSLNQFRTAVGQTQPKPSPQKKCVNGSFFPLICLVRQSSLSGCVLPLKAPSISVF